MEMGAQHYSCLLWLAIWRILSMFEDSNNY